jgi:hypothetical protein
VTGGGSKLVTYRGVTMKYLVVLSCLMLNGCFFFMVPLPSSDTFSYANTCVGSENAVVGKRIKHNDGRIGTIKTVYGSSDRCRKDAALPILTEVEYQ